MDNNTTIAEMDRQTVENEALRMCTDLFNRVDETMLDVTKLELVLRNMFGVACQWKEAVSEKESKSRKSYTDGLEDMLNTAIDNHDEDFFAFMDKVENAKNVLLGKQYTNKQS
ncbi:MAG: hypothetical protein BGO29_02715 [Bacteroidales bacterium 36-12]|nr:MAG: hypothetical protein BGO29_02715 [Bacteroidales bacterium 36-12]